MVALDDICARFGTALREWRVRKRLTQERLAERSGLSYKFIGEIERGQGNPTLTTMERLARALDVPLTTLVDSQNRVRSTDQDYRISKRELQAVREAVSSIDALVDSIGNPRYRIKRRARR